MEYSKEFCMTTIQRIKKELGLNWKEMAELFEYSNSRIVNLAFGIQTCSQKAFEKHFGPIESYFGEAPIDIPKAKVEKATVVEEPKQEVVSVPKKTGIVLTADTLPELKELLGTIGYHMEFVAM